jgi:competence ComEA-like helix-hairpin-helix protein
VKTRFILNNYKRIVLFATVLVGLACGKVATDPRAPASIEERRIETAININVAGEEELQKIPRIGPKLAKDIVEFRTQYGPFRRPEQLMLIQGISDRRFREIKNYVRVE